MQAMQELQVRSLGGEDPLEEGMETHSSILAWRISWTEEPGGLQSTGSQRVGHDWSTNTSHFHAFPVQSYMLAGLGCLGAEGSPPPQSH